MTNQPAPGFRNQFKRYAVLYGELLESDITDLSLGAAVRSRGRIDMMQGLDGTINVEPNACAMQEPPSSERT